MVTKKTYKPTDYYFTIGQKVCLRKRAPNFSNEDEKRQIKKGIAEIKAKHGEGPFYVKVIIPTDAHEMENVGHSQKLCLSKKRNGLPLKDGDSSAIFSGIFFH